MPPDSRTIYVMDTERTHRYEIRIVNDVLRSPEFEKALDGRDALIVTTPNVHRFYGERIESICDSFERRLGLLVIPADERHKTLEAVEVIIREAMRRQLDRRGALVAIGGGVCSDLVTVAASLFRRGVMHLRIPTTLVGQVDAGIGVKGAVNVSDTKSAVGCFHPPGAVMLDPTLLSTLPRVELRSGLAEILKMALVSDESLFDLLAEGCGSLLASRFQRPGRLGRDIVQRAARLMLEALAENLFEDCGYRRTVDAGHTFSPLIESTRGFMIRHGEAVAVDLAFSAVLACDLGLLDRAARDRLIDTIAAVGLPVDDPALSIALCGAALEKAERHRGGQVNLPLPTKIGTVTFVERREDLPEVLLASAIRQLRAIGRRKSNAEQAGKWTGASRVTAGIGRDG